MPDTEFKFFPNGRLPERHTADDKKATQPEIRNLLAATGLPNFLESKEATKELPTSVDLREWCSPVQFQGGYNSCAAHAVSGLMEFAERRAFNKSVTASRLFLYNVSKRLLGEKGNLGVYVRTALGTLTLFGVPPEKFFPYLNGGTSLKDLKSDDPRIDAEPDAFLYGLAQGCRGTTSYRLDDKSRRSQPNGELVLQRCKAHLAAGIPVAFGFSLFFDICVQSVKDGFMAFPLPTDKFEGDHAVMAVGYDDKIKIRNKAKGGPVSEGAILFKNSWGKEWGADGFGWLPYDYVLRDPPEAAARLATVSGSPSRASDFWILTKADWIETGKFQLKF